MDRDARHRAFHRQVAISDKAHELGIRQHLSGYSQMTPEQRRAVSPQVSRLAKELGHPNADGIKRFLLPPYMLFDSRDYQAEYDQNTAAERNPYSYAYGAPASAERNPYSYAYGAHTSLKDPLATQQHIQQDICKFYIAKLNIVKEELERVKEENARLEKENAALIELLPGRGRGGSRKRTIRRKRRH